MKRLIATFYKEFLVLSRDRAGLALLFIMPVVLITIMALIQDAPFRDYQELKVDVLWVDEDSTQFSEQLKDGLLESNRFRLVMKRDKVFLTQDEAISLTSKGESTFAVVIPKVQRMKFRRGQELLFQDCCILWECPWIQELS